MTDVHHELVAHGDEETPYRLLTTDWVSTGDFEGREMLKVDTEGLAVLADTAFRDSAHLLRPGHLAQLRTILDDPEASDNDRFVAIELLKNANIAAGGVLPMCQDTGTAIVMGKKGNCVWTEGDDEAALSRGIKKAFEETNLRYSQVAPLTMFEEANTRTNLPAQIEIYASQGSTYEFVFMAKGGGSANKSFLFQETRALLNPEGLRAFIDEKLRMIGTAACPPPITWPSSSAAPQPSTPSRRRSWPASATSTICRPGAARTARRSAISTWRPRCSR